MDINKVIDRYVTTAGYINLHLMEEFFVSRYNSHCISDECLRECDYIYDQIDPNEPIPYGVEYCTGEDSWIVGEEILWIALGEARKIAEQEGNIHNGTLADVAEMWGWTEEDLREYMEDHDATQTAHPTFTL